jgi:negative regulator of sigma E activity
MRNIWGEGSTIMLFNATLTIMYNPETRATQTPQTPWVNPAAREGKALPVSYGTQTDNQMKGTWKQTMV